jgi:hypothetical protein
MRAYAKNVLSFAATMSGVPSLVGPKWPRLGKVPRPQVAQRLQEPFAFGVRAANLICEDPRAARGAQGVLLQIHDLLEGGYPRVAYEVGPLAVFPLHVAATSKSVHVPPRQLQ